MVAMQPENTTPPDLPDAAMPSIEPVQAQPQPTPMPQPVAGMPRPAAAPTPQPVQPTPAGAGAEATRGRHRLTHIGKKYFKLIEFDEEEELLAEIRKHPFGLFVILLTGFLIAVALFVGVAFLASTSFLESVGLQGTNAAVVFAGFLLSLLVIVVTMINAHLYYNNVIFVTNEKIAQVLFITLFNRKISQLSIGDVQDVTVQQDGFLPNLLGYGTLVIETAGEQQNYTFTFIPHPYENSKVIINAHESNLKVYGN